MFETVVIKKGQYWNGTQDIDYELKSLVFRGINRQQRRRNMKLYGHPLGRLQVKTDSNGEVIKFFE